MALHKNPSTAAATSKKTLNRIIFESDTAAGKAFDIALIACILLSVAVVMADSVDPLKAAYGRILYGLEWFFTILFTVEYVLRLYCARRMFAYARSFYGIIDLLAVLPTYISLLIPASRYLIVIRILRVLRIFRILKLATYLGEARVLSAALIASRRKIIVFLIAVMTLVVIFGSLMYLIEGPANGFTSIPQGVYWAIVTLTTVGYGDISPKTVPGQTIAAIIMIIGYGIIAVPTGIVTSELTTARKRKENGTCSRCRFRIESAEANYCPRCGQGLDPGIHAEPS